MHKLITITLLMACAGIGCQRNQTDTGDDKDSKQPNDPADNSYCYVCHINYKSEDITMIHAEKGVGCEACHGMSEAHSSDENGLTAPDRMFAQDRVTPYCASCHSVIKLRRVEKHMQFVFTKNREDRKVCTDCHGKHRLENRTRKWNKATGVLIWKDGAPIMDQAEKP